MAHVAVGWIVPSSMSIVAAVATVVFLHFFSLGWHSLLGRWLLMPAVTGMTTVVVVHFFIRVSGVFSGVAVAMPAVMGFVATPRCHFKAVIPSRCQRLVHCFVADVMVHSDCRPWRLQRHFGGLNAVDAFQCFFDHFDAVAAGHS